MELEPIVGMPVRFPPGRVAIHLNQRHRSAYRRLYAQYQSILSGLPVLRECDFDGRAVTVTTSRLAALNAAFAKLSAGESAQASAFGAQESARKRLFKRLQYLS